MSGTAVSGLFRLDGRTAFVSGGAGHLGRAMVTALAGHGAHVIVNGRNEARLSAFQAEMQSAGIDVSTACFDMMDFSAARAFFGGLERLDVLVNNAGVAIHGDTPDFAEETWRRLMSLNVDAVFWACKAAIPAMVKNGGGTIVNMGSMSGIASNIPQNQVAYNSSKAAVHMMTKSLASEFAAQNIRVNAVAPGPVATELFLQGKSPELIDRLAKLNPLERLGQPDDIARVVAFLAGPDGAWINGQILRANGGMC